MRYLCLREAMLRGLLSRHPAGPPLCAARGQNASQWWLCCCSAAKRPACVWLSSVALSQCPASSSRPQKEKHLFSLAWHREAAILLLLMLPAPECFHFVFADGRCPAVFFRAPARCRGRGKPCPSGSSLSLTHSCIPGTR